MEAALTVPETLLLVGTSERVLASIADACRLLGEDIWEAEDVDTNADAVESPTSTTTGGFVSDSEASEHGYDFVVLLPTTCGLEHTIGNPLFPDLDAVHAQQSYRFGSPFHLAGGGVRGFGSEPDVSSDTRDGVEIKSTGGDAAAYDERVHDADFDHRANLLAGSLGPDGPLVATHREITRLVALHGEASCVLALCAAPLGLILRRDNDDDPDRAAFLPNAHDAL